MAEAVDMDRCLEEAHEVGVGLEGVDDPRRSDRGAQDNRVVADIGAQIDHRVAGARKAQHHLFDVQFPGAIYHNSRCQIDVLGHHVKRLAAMRPAEDPVAEKYRGRPRRRLRWRPDRVTGVELIAAHQISDQLAQVAQPQSFREFSLLYRGTAEHQLKSRDHLLVRRLAGG